MPDRFFKGSDKAFFDARYRQIRDFEAYLYENGYRMIKIFLNLSMEEQTKRMISRIDEPKKNWKFSLGQTTGEGNKFKGQVDELRFEGVRRSADWVKACYMNQKGSLVGVSPANTGMTIFIR